MVLEPFATVWEYQKFLNLKPVILAVLMAILRANPKNGQTHSNNSSAICRRIVLVCLTILWNWHLKG